MNQSNLNLNVIKHIIVACWVHYMSDTYMRIPKKEYLNIQLAVIKEYSNSYILKSLFT